MRLEIRWVRAIKSLTNGKVGSRQSTRERESHLWDAAVNFERCTPVQLAGERIGKEKASLVMFTNGSPP
jgi:hypothetical protein